MNLLFAADSIWVWDAEKKFSEGVREHPEVVQAAEKGKRVGDNEGDVDATKTGH